MSSFINDRFIKRPWEKNINWLIKGLQIRIYKESRVCENALINDSAPLEHYIIEETLAVQTSQWRLWRVRSQFSSVCSKDASLRDEDDFRSSFCASESEVDQPLKWTGVQLHFSWPSTGFCRKIRWYTNIYIQINRNMHISTAFVIVFYSYDS